MTPGKEDQRRQLIYKLTLFVFRTNKTIKYLEDELLRWPVFEVLCSLVQEFD